VNIQQTSSQIARLARINESVSSITFDAVQDADGMDWIVRWGTVRIVDSISEEDAKEIAAVLCNSLLTGVTAIVEKNNRAITDLINSIPGMANGK
jgi:hypothetical protein